MSPEGLRFAAVVVPLVALALAWAEWPSLREEWGRAREPDPKPDAHRHGRHLSEMAPGRDDATDGRRHDPSTARQRPSREVL